jgi:hypothetical protein
MRETENQPFAEIERLIAKSGYAPCRDTLYPLF